MANLGICRKCKSCQKLSLGLLDGQDRQIASALVWCILSGPVPESIGWNSEVPDNCPYRLEHIVTNDAFSDLVDSDMDEGD